MGRIAGGRDHGAGRQAGLEPGVALAIRPSPSARLIHQKNQRLTRSSGTPRAAARTFSSWGPQDEKPVAELEIYRPGGELNPSEALSEAEIAARMDPGGARGLEPAGVVDSKFGTVTLLRLTDDTGGAKSCLGFLKRLGDAALQISGWSCQGDGIPARRAAIGCMLNRLTLLSAGNEPKLAELFARAELRRGGCATPAAPAVSTDWLTGAEDPRLRGPF